MAVENIPEVVITQAWEQIGETFSEILRESIRAAAIGFGNHGRCDKRSGASACHCPP